METQNISVIYGEGSGKTAAAIGKAIRFISEGKTVSVIQFLKGNREEAVLNTLEQFEPEMKVFRFERHTGKFNSLPENEKKDELNNIRNGVNFARKVLITGGCDVLILDEILGLVDRNIMEAGELADMLKSVSDDMEVIITGRKLPEEIRRIAGKITVIENE